MVTRGVTVGTLGIGHATWSFGAAMHSMVLMSTTIHRIVSLWCAQGKPWCASYNVDYVKLGSLSGSMHRYGAVVKGIDHHARLMPRVTDFQILRAPTPRWKEARLNPSARYPWVDKRDFRGRGFGEGCELG